MSDEEIFVCHYNSSSLLQPLLTLPSLHNIKLFIAEDEASTDSGDTVDDDDAEVSDSNWNDHGRYRRGMALYSQRTQDGRHRTN